MKWLGLVGLALVATPAEAQSLWGDVRVGMTVAEVRALRSIQGRIRHDSDSERTRLAGERVGACPVDVTIRHPEGVVTYVAVSPPLLYGSQLGEAMGGDKCGADAAALLRSRYGQPQTVSGNESTWRRDGIEIEFSRSGPERSAGWTIFYRPPR